MQPEIVGPGAASIEIDMSDCQTAPDIPTVTEESIKEELPQIDPSFPFGHPDNLDYSTLDKAGQELVAAINLRPWIKTVEYCSGHPFDRPTDENSALYPYGSGENVYEEINKLDAAYVRGLLPEVYFRTRKADLRSAGATRFYLNVNVYNMIVFTDWIKLFSGVVTLATQTHSNPLVVRLNPTRPGINYSLYWDYWCMEERTMIHYLALDTLNHFPV